MKRQADIKATAMKRITESSMSIYAGLVQLKHKSFEGRLHQLGLSSAQQKLSHVIQRLTPHTSQGMFIAADPIPRNRQRLK